MTSTHPYLRRRVRPVPRDSAATQRAAGTECTAATPPTAGPTGGGTPAPGTGLTLSGPAVWTAPAVSVTPSVPRPQSEPIPPSTGPSARVAARLAARGRRVRPFPAPDPRDVQVLDARTPVVRVDRRRSAVGSLVVAGCTSTVWESTDHVVGAATVDGATAGRAVGTPGNRPLVGFDDGVALVALRHVRSLRRALFIARGAERMTVALHDGTTLAVDPGTGDTTTILALSVVDGELELRAEPFPRSPHDGEVFAAFGFTLSAPSIGA